MAISTLLLPVSDSATGNEFHFYGVAFHFWRKGSSYCEETKMETMTHLREVVVVMMRVMVLVDSSIVEEEKKQSENGG
jgi:hypothetical protein